MGTEPDIPYSKKPLEPRDTSIKVPPAPPPQPPPLKDPTAAKFTCSKCGKVFTTREELTLHMETVHQSPKKQV